MLLLCMFAILVGSCLSAMSEHQKLVKIFGDMDINKNGLLTAHDLGAYLQGIGNDPHSNVEKERFLTTWIQRYGDTNVAAEVIFQFFDGNGNGVLSVDDYVDVFNKMDGYGDASKRDKLVTFVEFEKAFKKLYSQAG